MTPVQSHDGRAFARYAENTFDEITHTAFSLDILDAPGLGDALNRGTIILFPFTPAKGGPVFIASIDFP